MSSQFVDRLTIRRRPRGLPLMRQWWGTLLFMHWPMAPGLLRPLVPPPLSIDTFDGRAWVGVVPFTMWGVRPYLAPPLPSLNSFRELNVRTYVHYEGVPGVLFLSMDIDSSLAAWAARQFFSLPYYPARMDIRRDGYRIAYDSTRAAAGDESPADFSARWSIGEPLAQAEPGTLDFFLTERYCLYTARGAELYRLRVAHAPWPLRRAELDAHDSNLLEALNLPAPQGDPLLHYAEAIKVDIFPLRRVPAAPRRRLFETANAPEAAG